METGSVNVVLGTMVEITPQDVTDIRELTEEAQRLAYHRDRGWLRLFLQNHGRQRRLIQEIIARSHAN